jgi:hypothetical protein
MILEFILRSKYIIIIKSIKTNTINVVEPEPSIIIYKNWI